MPLGDEGGFVEQAGNGPERGQIDLDNAGGQCVEPVAGRREGGRRLRVAAEFKVGRMRDANAQAGRQRPRQRGRHRPRERIGGVVAGHHAVDRVGVLDREREDRDAVEAAAGRHHAAGGDGTQRRLEADDVVEPGRDPAGPGRVGAERETDQAAGDRHGRARRGATGHDGRIEGLVRRRIGRAHAHEPGGELVEIGLADQDRTGGQQAGHRGRRLGRPVGKARAGRGRGQSGDVDVVLHGERHAPQRQHAPVLRRERAGGRQGLRLGHERDEDAGITGRGDRGVDLPHHGIRRGSGRVGGAQPGKVDVEHGHEAPSCASRNAMGGPVWSPAHPAVLPRI